MLLCDHYTLSLKFRRVVYLDGIPIQFHHDMILESIDMERFYGHWPQGMISPHCVLHRPISSHIRNGAVQRLVEGRMKYATISVYVS